MQLALATSLIVFFALMIGISIWAGKKVHTGEDFIIAGRSLPGIMSTATIMATWFAAETILVTADTVRTDGIQITVLEPLGIGICLILAGVFVARRLWETGHLTLADVIGARFGKTAEKLQAFVVISYVGWVAVQLLGLAGVFNVYFDLPIFWGVVLVTTVLTGYTLVGGLWSVAMTDVVQLGMLIVGIVILTIAVLDELGGGPFSGFMALVHQLDAKLLVFVPTGSYEEVSGWVGLIVIGMFANIATQDLAQRMLAARSAQIAERSAVTAGILYIIFGSMPVILGLAGSVLLDDSVVQGVIPALAAQLLSPTMAVIFALTLTAAVTSSVDSGLLAPAAVIARNIIGPFTGERIHLITLTRICVVAVALTAATMALSGTRAFELIQGSYSITLPPLVTLLAALYQKRTHPLPGTLTLAFGIGFWFYEIGSNIASGGTETEVLSPGFPVIQLVSSIAIYWVTDLLVRRFDRSQAAGAP